MTPPGSASDAARRIAALEAEIDALRAELARRADTLLAYEDEIDDLGTALAELGAERDAALRRVEALEAETERRRSQNEAALERARAEVERLLHSRSFRMTAPLRRLHAYLARR